MEIYRVAFIGLREIHGLMRIENRLYDILMDLLYKHEYVEFYVGRNGAFDIFVSSVIKCVQRDFGHHNSCLILVLPYDVKDRKDYEKYYDEVVFPNDRDTHYKSAITKRNYWMMDNFELLICYIDHKSGGSYTAMEYAEKRGEPILNLTIKDNF